MAPATQPQPATSSQNAAPSDSSPTAPAQGTAGGLPAPGGRLNHGFDGDAGGPAGGTVSDGNVVLTIKVAGARNIRGVKGEHVNSFVRVQFADFDYKESPVAIDTSSPEYNFALEQTFHIDEGLVDIFSNKKICLTLIESLPKEKTQVLGTAEFKLDAFVQYSPRDPNSDSHAQPSLPPLSLKETATISYLNPRLLPPPSKDGEPNSPEFNIIASISNPLIAAEVVENGSFITIGVDDMFPVPDEWTLKEGTEKDLNSNVYSYSLSFMVPAESSLERQIVISGGSLTTYEATGQDAPAFGAQPIFMKAQEQTGPESSPEARTAPRADAPQQPRFDGTAPQTPAVSDRAPKDGGAMVAAGGSGNASGSGANGGAAGGGTTSGGVGGSGGGGGGGNVVAPSAGGGDTGSSIMQTFRKVAWAQSFVIWMPPEAVVRLREKIIAKQPLEAEFYREMQPKFSHLTDPNPLKYRAKAILDISCLLFPRVVGLKGRFPIDCYDPPSSPGDIAPGVVEAALAVKKGAKAKDEVDLALYKNLGSHVGIQISLEKPLLDRKKLQPVTKAVHDFIPRRTVPYSTLFEKKSAKADDDYRKEVQEVVRVLIDEYRSILQSDLAGVVDDFEVVNTTTPQEQILRHKRFLYHLNKSGAYFSLKEQLKTTVVNIVRERFQKKSPFASKSELQLFMSEVYVYLVDQMHIAINKMFKDTDDAFIDPSVSRTADFKHLKLFADRAEFENSLQIAASYHLERIAKFGDSMQAWFDYGSFCMRNGMPAKGEECFREILSRNDKHIPSLLACGSLCCCCEKFEESRVLLTTATELQPRYCLAAVVMGLYYEIAGEELESEKVLTEAQKLKPADIPCAYLHAGRFLIQIHAGQLAERALSHAIIESGPSVEPYLLLSQLEKQRGNTDLAMTHIHSAIDIRQDDPDAWAALGHLQFASRMWGEARTSYETVLSLPAEPNDVTTTYVRLGTLYLMQAGPIMQKAAMRSPVEIEFAAKAKSMFLRGCEAGPTAKSWLGVGKACLYLGNLTEAEDAFAEANVLNNRDSDVWAHLAYVCLMQDRQFEGNQCISQALHQGIKDPEILRIVGLQFMQSNHAAPASECFRIALELEPTSVETKQLFARALSMQSRDYLDTSAAAGVARARDGVDLVDMAAEEEAILGEEEGRCC
ncbi:hypothetical protein DFJ73DRAFT_810162 [Zopfochytrium polystomum]|nr:hypothetical protein DFJ73DRAFT_810162 [Zopfochytrium polystomum]